MIEVFKPAIRNAWCDCIRGYAILLVCAEHIFHIEPFASYGSSVTHFFKGDTGVFLFYVLSGFLVTGILARELEEQPCPKLRWRAGGQFFVSRLFRLQPSYLLFLTIYALISPKDGALSWWVLLLPLSNWFTGPYTTWHIKTLHIEETYY